MSSKFLRAWWLAAAISVLIWGFIAWDLVRLHDHSLRDAQRHLENVVDIYAEEVTSSINAIDYLLIDFRDEWNGDTESFEELVQQRRAYVDPEMGYNASIINRQGQLLVTTVAVAKLPMDLSDRESFQYHLHEPADTLHVGTPILMRVKNQWGIPFTRPLFDKAGRFDGLIGLTVLPEYFSRFHQRVDLGEGSSIFLGRMDGYMLARHPHPEIALGGAITGAPWLSAAPGQTGFFWRQSQIDRTERIYVWRTLERGNLAVVMGKSMTTILAPYHRQRTIYLTGGTAASMLLLLAAYLWKRYRAHRAKAEAELQKMEAALAHSRKLESLGKLTGGVTHDFNHILQIITSNLQVINMACPATSQIEPHLKSISAATARGAKLAAQLLTFARRQPLHPTVIDLAELLGRIDKLLQQLVGSGIDAHIAVSEQAWPVRVDADLFENMILNLAANARDAMNGRGTLSIRVDNESINPGQDRRYPDIAPGDYVLVAMTDTGCGMSAEVMGQAFEPFFTTKPEGKGTGLGLAMAYGFVKESHGHIYIESALGKGTTIRVLLPRSEPEETVTPAAPADTLTGGSETILFVDDSAELRRMMGMMLEHAGYRVLRASHAQEALAILERDEAIDVLLTDLRMPGALNGLDLARVARSNYPDLIILLASGNDELNDAPDSLAKVHGFPFLSKPYTIQEVDAILRQLLASKKRNTASA